MSDRRTGHDTLYDLADAAASLRNVAVLAEEGLYSGFPAVGDDETIGQDDLRRWAYAIDEIVSYPTWKARASLMLVMTIGVVLGWLIGVAL